MQLSLGLRGHTQVCAYLTRLICEQREITGDTSPLSPEESGVLSETLSFFFPVGGVTTQPLTRVTRYQLLWGKVVMLNTTPHGFRRTRRARSLKKRLTKRLVKRTQFRF